MNLLSTLSALRREKSARGGLGSLVWATLSGLAVPVLIVMVGVIAWLLDAGAIATGEIRLGNRFVLGVPSGLLPAWLIGLSGIGQLAALVGLALAVSLLFSGVVWMNRRSADARARRVVKELHSRVFRQSLRRAEIEGATAQSLRAAKLIGEQLPVIQSGLSLWYRVIPRSVLMLIGCLVLALMVDVWLTVLAVISGLLVWRLQRHLRSPRETELTRWEVPRSRQRMAELVGRAPLLARLQSQSLADRTFAAELESLYRRLTAEDQRRGRVWPLLFASSAVVIAVLLMGIGVNLTDAQRGLGLPATMLMGLALTAAAISVGRLGQLASRLPSCNDAAESIYRYLDHDEGELPSEQRVGIAGLQEAIEFRNVTLSDSAGHEILRDLSLRLEPKSFVALLGTEPVTCRALVELMMGFGRPSGGDVRWDGRRLLDIHPQAMARHVMWIEPGGPIWDGTILENLKGDEESIDNSEVMEALERVGVYDQVLRLPDGIQTIVAAGEHGLDVETTYGIGLARALLHHPAIVLAVEPSPPAEHLASDPCLRALRDLARGGSLVVVLPHRLSTLREADRVVLFNGPQSVGEGRHAELLRDSDLYRHLNYVLFNPYRHEQAVG